MAMVVIGAILTGYAASALATDTNSTTASTTSTTSSSNLTDVSIGFDMGFGGGHGGHGHGSMGTIEVSAEYNQTVTAILNNDSDVTNLISQGYNVTSIRPIIKSTVSGDGTVTSKATTAIVELTNGTSGKAAVTVDITNAKVTQIVILTRTVIDKSTS
jgi:hypothetical protein